MKKALLIAVLTIGLISTALAEPKAGVSYMYNIQTKENRVAIEGGDHTTFRFGNKDKQVRFALGIDSVLGISNTDVGSSLPIHLDLGVAVIPGVSIAFGEHVELNVGLGLKYARFGYNGDDKEANGWDKFLSVISFKLLGNMPTRTFGPILDVNLKLFFMRIGFYACYYVMEPSLSVSTYATLSLK